MTAGGEGVATGVGATAGAGFTAVEPARPRAARGIRPQVRPTAEGVSDAISTTNGLIATRCASRAPSQTPRSPLASFRCGALSPSPASDNALQRARQAEPECREIRLRAGKRSLLRRRRISADLSARRFDKAREPVDSVFGAAKHRVHFGGVLLDQLELQQHQRLREPSLPVPASVQQYDPTASGLCERRIAPAGARRFSRHAATEGERTCTSRRVFSQALRRSESSQRW